MDGFGKRLVELRERKGLTQRRLAELLEITPTRLNYWEKDKREPDLFMFVKILKVLGADANELLGLDKSNNQSIPNKYSELNQLGQQKADEYIKDLSENPKYTTNTTIADDITEELKQVSIKRTSIK